MKQVVIDLEKVITEMIVDLEKRQLTHVELSFSSGWKFRLNHPKATKQLIGLKKGEKVTYPRNKGFKESHLTSPMTKSVGMEKEN